LLLFRLQVLFFWLSEKKPEGVIETASKTADRFYRLNLFMAD
jgi:hypothetical protein